MKYLQMSVYLGLKMPSRMMWLLMLALFVWGCSLPSDASEQPVGQVTFLVGKAQQTKGGVTKALRRGDSVDLGATLETAANGHVHVRFVDGALVSLRPGSMLRITEYHFNRAVPSASKVKFELDQGTARAVTGEAGKSAKENFRLNTPVAALGVRGTDFSVFSSLNESLVSVNSGAVVVSQFGDGCSRSSSGPCAGLQSLEIRAGATKGSAALVSLASERPLVLPEGTVKLSPAVPLTPRVTTVSDQLAAPAVGSEGVVVSETLAVEGVERAITTSGDVRLPTAGANPSKLAWGRWYGAAWPSDQTMTYLQAMDGRKVTVGNTYVSLYRIPEASFLLPDKGSARLALQSGQVHWIGALTREPGKIDSGTLTVNFSDRRFVTELTGTHPRVGAFNLQASGVLSTSQLAPGIFVSDTSSTGARVAGAVTSNATEAGYFFEQPASRSILMGTTNWRR